MKYYVIKNSDIIYGGEVHKDDAGQITADIKIYYKKDPLNQNKWEECQNKDLHIDHEIAVQYYKGFVTEFPTFNVAKNIIESKR